MVFVELPIFTKRIQGHLTDADLWRLQSTSDHGQVKSFQAVGGVRKICVPMQGRGKRGGGRVIYYVLDDQDRIYLLFFYPRSQHVDLTPQQLRLLKQALMDTDG